MQIGYIKECKCPADFRHPDGTGTLVDCVALDHYIKTECHPTVPLILAHALYDGLTSVRYGSKLPVVSVTTLMKCMRTFYYEVHTEWVAKLLETSFMLRGTFAHEGMLAGMQGKPGWIIEQNRQMVLDTGYGNVTLFGTPDAVYRGKVFDLKTQQEFAVQKKLKATDAELLQDVWVKDNVTQVNVYAALLRNDGIPIHAGELHYMDGKWKDTSGKCRVRKLPVPMQPNDAVLDWVRPRAAVAQAVLDKALPPSQIPAKEWVGWKPKTGVQYLVDRAA